MAFTDSCDLYAAFDEAGANLIARHVMRQRPSLFNYATAYIRDRPKLACEPVAATKDVTDYGNALFHLQLPLPLLGADAPPVGLNYCVQLVEAKVDFFPSNAIALPAELNGNLAPQTFALFARVCAGLDCLPNAFIDEISPWPPSQQPNPGPNDPAGREPGPTAPPPIVPPSRRLLCVCLDAFLVGHVTIENLFGRPTLVGHADAVDIVDIKPDVLEDALTCYLRATVELLLREKLTFPVVGSFVPNFDFLKLPKITVGLTPNPPIPNNPAIEKDAIAVFLDITVGP